MKEENNKIDTEEETKKMSVSIIENQTFNNPTNPHLLEYNLYNKNKVINLVKSFLNDIREYKKNNRIPEYNPRMLYRQLGIYPTVNIEIVNMVHYTRIFWRMWETSGREIPEIFNKYKNIDYHTLIHLCSSDEIYNFDYPSLR